MISKKYAQYIELTRKIQKNKGALSDQSSYTKDEIVTLFYPIEETVKVVQKYGLFLPLLHKKHRQRLMYLKKCEDQIEDVLQSVEIVIHKNNQQSAFDFVDKCNVIDEFYGRYLMSGDQTNHEERYRFAQRVQNLHGDMAYFTYHECDARVTNHILTSHDSVTSDTIHRAIHLFEKMEDLVCEEGWPKRLSHRDVYMLGEYIYNYAGEEYIEKRERCHKMREKKSSI